MGKANSQHENAPRSRANKTKQYWTVDACTTAWSCRFSITWLDLCTLLYCFAVTGLLHKNNSISQQMHKHMGQWRTCACDACSSQPFRSNFFSTFSHLFFLIVFLFGCFARCPRCRNLIHIISYQEHPRRRTRKILAWGSGVYPKLWAEWQLTWTPES